MTKETKLNDKINKRRRVQIFFKDVSLAQQNLKEEVDINNIVKKYQVTGELPENPKQGFYGDVSNVPDYREALDIVQTAQNSFNALPAKIRAEFLNDPGTMMKWLDNPENHDRAVELGLLVGDTTRMEPKQAEKAVKKEASGDVQPDERRSGTAGSGS